MTNVLSLVTCIENKEFKKLVRRIAKLVSTDFVASDINYCPFKGSSKLIVIHTEKTLEEFLEWIDKNQISVHEIKQLTVTW